MSWSSKVVWSEGLFLRPQHFQQQDRHFEWLVEARTGLMTPFGWGFSRLEIDENALATGKVFIQNAAGVMPDGTPFEFPAAHEAPLALEFPPDARDSVVCLALPSRRPFSAEFVEKGDENPLARYDILETGLPDSTCASTAAETVQIGQPRFVLELESRLPDTYLKLGAIRITERRPDRALLPDRSFIPPILACSLSTPLDGMLHEIQGLLNQRGEALAGRLTQAGHGGVSEIADFLFLLAINRFQPVFEHLGKIALLHPERLYTEMLKLMGELATLVSGNHRPAELPPYQHDNLQMSFASLMQEIRRALSTILEQNAVQIELADHKQGRYVGLITDRGLLHQASFVLAVNAQIPSETLRTRFPAQAKLGPVEKIRDLVNLQLPGISLHPLPVAPRQLPFHAGFSYFELETGNDLWKQLDSSGGLGMYVSGEFPGLEVSLWAIRN